MIRYFITSFLIIMITMLLVGVVYLAITGGAPADLVPILVGAAVVGVPISTWGAWKNRNR